MSDEIVPAESKLLQEPEPPRLEAIEVEPGIYQDVRFDDYARWNAVNHSKLRHFSKTPAHARDAFVYEPEGSKYQDLGHALHQALLEPQLFDELYLVAPKVDRRTKIGKATWAQFEEYAKGRTVVTQDEMDMMRGLLSSIASHPTAREALYGLGVSELSLVWIDPETGLKCKARIDRLCELGGWAFIVDVKTTHKPASTHSWQMSVEKYVMHEQAAHYIRGLSVLSPLEGDAVRKFAWLVCETERPYCVRMFEADTDALKIGNDNVSKHMAMYRQCRETGVWPGWGDGMDVAGLPPWTMKRYDLE